MDTLASPSKKPLPSPGKEYIPSSHPSTHPPLLIADPSVHTDVDICIRTQHRIRYWEDGYTNLCVAYALERLFGNTCYRFHESDLRGKVFFFINFLGGFFFPNYHSSSLLLRKLNWESSFLPLLSRARSEFSTHSHFQMIKSQNDG